MRVLKPCGTEAAYRRHLRNGEPACEKCRAANATAVANASRRESRIKARGPLGHFWAKVALPDENGCMLWLGNLRNGYGYTTVDGKKAMAHRIALIHSVGISPDPCRKEAAHSCRNTHCVAPDHLRWASHAENMADKRRDGTEHIGERNPGAKLTEESVRAISASYFKDGRTQLDLGREYGVSAATIGDILNGRTWAHLWVDAS